MALKSCVALELFSCLLFVNLSLVCSETELSWQDCPKDEEENLIDCSDFRLTKIPLDIYDSSWQIIQLGSNPFNCDCSMNTFLHEKRFPKYLRRTVDLKDAQCAKPTRYAGLPILKLADDPTFCQDASEKVDQENDFWSFFKMNARFVASIVLVCLLLMLALATCFKKCEREDYLSHYELLSSHSKRNTKRNPFFLSKLFGRSPKNIISLNEFTELSEEDDDDTVYEIIR